MEKFGDIKNKVLHKMVDSYSGEDKSDMKKIMKIINENKDFKQMYLLYEEIESLNLYNKEMANEYIANLCEELKNNPKKVKSTITQLSPLLSEVQVNENELYSHLDNLFESNKLTNIPKKVKSKDYIINYLIKEKTEEVIDEPTIVENHGEMLGVLVNYFNNSFKESLTEEEKETFKTIISLNELEVENKIKTLQNEITDKINTVINESTDDELITKLKLVKESVETIENSRTNIYTLIELKSDLIKS